MSALLALAFAVRALALPAHSTIDSFGARSMMAVSRDGTVAATVTLGGFSTRAVIWNAAGGWHLLAVPALPPGAQSIDLAVAGFDGGGALLANAGASYGGSIRRLHYIAMRAHGTLTAPIDFGTCPYLPHSPGAVIAGTYADGDAVATLESQELVDINDTSGQLAPVVVRLRGSECTYLGNGTVFATAGAYAAGYVGYVGNVPQSPSVVAKKRYEALRWHGDERKAVGAGAALAVAPDGAVAGADAPPGLGSDFGIEPHARLWPASGDPIDLTGAPEPSAAYAIDASGRVAGMLEDTDGRHHAFLWHAGKLQRLDDIAGAPDWRFECAYAFAPDGSIVGIGIYRGKATAFEISPR
jgi:probable HAF family extracellular repeat protein